MDHGVLSQAEPRKKQKEKDEDSFHYLDFIDLIVK